jgi:Na+-translocating ferredoxin:NAD+ oxidoreductase RnfD subunit
MLSVAIALAPSSIAGIVFFGLPAVLMLLTAVISSIGAEVVYELCVGKKFKTIF